MGAKDHSCKGLKKMASIVINVGRGFITESSIIKVFTIASQLLSRVVRKDHYSVMVLVSRGFRSLLSR